MFYLVCYFLAPTNFRYNCSMVMHTAEDQESKRTWGVDLGRNDVEATDFTLSFNGMLCLKSCSVIRISLVFLG